MIAKGHAAGGHVEEVGGTGVRTLVVVQPGTDQSLAPVERQALATGLDLDGTRPSGTPDNADVSLAEGDVDEDECTIECWKHGSLFCLQTGAALTLPATRPVPGYDVEIDDQFHRSISGRGAVERAPG